MINKDSVVGLDTSIVLSVVFSLVLFGLLLFRMTRALRCIEESVVFG